MFKAKWICAAMLVLAASMVASDQDAKRTVIQVLDHAVLRTISRVAFIEHRIRHELEVRFTPFGSQPVDADGDGLRSTFLPPQAGRQDRSRLGLPRRSSPAFRMQHLARARCHLSSVRGGSGLHARECRRPCRAAPACRGERGARPPSASGALDRVQSSANCLSRLAARP